MGSFERILEKKKENTNQNENGVLDIRVEGNTIKTGNESEIIIGSKYVGDISGSSYHDFYVYEWLIKETGEIFYVGKGRGDRYKEYHENAYEAEKIRSLFEVEYKFVARNLSEQEALELETNEMTRILNETEDRLTNQIIPYFANRDNGYSRGPSTPELKFETAPVLYASEIEEHYYGTKWRAFDTVELDLLNEPMIWDKVISPEEIEIVYGSNYEKYYSEVISLLEKHGSRIYKSKYAKSVSCWIYPFDDYVSNHDQAEKTAMGKLGRYIPTYHLIDVWKALVQVYGTAKETIEEFCINPQNNKVPLSKIENLNDCDRGFDEGFNFWERGDVERKAGNLMEAIELFDKARYKGYSAPALYDSYAKAYRKLKDLDNEIDVLNEAIERMSKEKHDYSQLITQYKEQRKKAIRKLIR